jgi:hypothetical protein
MHLCNLCMMMVLLLDWSRDAYTEIIVLVLAQLK